MSDSEIHTRRDQLVQTFEAAWGEIGWNLHKSKKTEDLIEVFSCFAESYPQDIMSALCRPSNEPASDVILRKVRAEWRALAEPRRTAHELSRRANERLQRADSALAHASRSERRIINQEQERLQEEVLRTENEFRNLANAEHRLEQRLQDLSASFSRREVFRFLKSKRYALNPLSLANATAGFPYMGWRQSTRRCKKASSSVANGLTYQIFRTIRFLLESAAKKTKEALCAHFRKSIPLLPSRYRLPRAELAENWFFLDRAIQQACGTQLHPRALPFEVTKLYFEQVHVRSQVDSVLAEVAKLSLLKKPPASRPRDTP